MATHVFSHDGDGRVQRLERTAFAHEGDLDSYVEHCPEILASALSSDGEELRFLLIERQASIDDVDGSMGRWSADLLFVDQRGVLTVVEDKLSSNPEIRRKIIGQVIEYAANLLQTFTIDGLRQRLERTHADVDAALSNLLGESEDPDDDPVERFWRELQRNLQAGAIRLVFVADRLPAELRRSISFLDKYMDPVEVVGVEITRMRGGEREVIVASTLGEIEKPVGSKSTPGGRQVPISFEDFRQEFYAINDATPEGRAATSIFEQLTADGNGLSFKCYRTAGAVPVCVLLRQSDAVPLMQFRVNPHRLRRTASVAYGRAPGEVKRSFVTEIGFEPTPKGGGIEEWCAEHPDNPSRFVEWIRRRVFGAGQEASTLLAQANAAVLE